MSKSEKRKQIKTRSWGNVYCWLRGHAKMKMKKGKGSYRRIKAFRSDD